MNMVPVVIYTDGVRHIVGKAEVVIADGHIKVEGVVHDALGWADFPGKFSADIPCKLEAPMKTEKEFPQVTLDNIIKGTE